jgi:hypothetical protein
MGMMGTVFVHKAATPYTEEVSISQGRTVSLIGLNLPVVLGANDTVDVQTSARSYVAGMRLEGGGADGLACSAATVWLDDSTVTNNLARGLDADDCQVHVRRSQLTLNSGDGIHVITSSALFLESSVVGRNGDSAAPSSGLSATSSTLTVLYSTIAGNNGNLAGGGDSVSCVSGASATFRNTIVVAESASSVDCPGATATYSAIDDADLTDATNALLPPFDAAWFQSVPAGDFHLVAAGSPFADVASWRLGDPATDLEGDLRPTTDASPDWPGADVP